MRTMIKSSFSLLALVFCSVAYAAPFAYVPNEESGTISVIDVAEI